jgi:hypothetical protein
VRAAEIFSTGDPAGNFLAAASVVLLRAAVGPRPARPLLTTLTDQEEPFGPARLDARERGRRLASAAFAPLRALFAPDRGVPPIVSAGRFRLTMAIAIGAALLAFAAGALRLDVAPAVRAENAGAPAPGASAPAPGDAGEVKTDREIDEEVGKRAAIARVKGAFAAGLGTPARIVLLGFGLFLLGRYVGGRPTLRRALAAAAVTALPWAVRSVIGAAAALRQDAVTSVDVTGLVSAGLPVAVDNAILARLVAGVDLFTLWSVVLCVFGLSAASGISRVRAAAAVTVGALLLMLLSLVGPP